MTSARFTNAEETEGVFVRPNGQHTHGLLPPLAGDIRDEYEQWIALGNEPASFAPIVVVPVKRVERLGVVRFTVASGLLTLTGDAVLVASAGRVSAGRYRAYFDPVDTDLTYLCSLSLRDAADLRVRTTAKTANYVEVRSVNAAGAATDAAEIIITIDKVVSS